MRKRGSGQFIVGGKVVMPVSVQAYHSFVDSLHIGRFVDRLQEFMEEL